MKPVRLAARTSRTAEHLSPRSIANLELDVRVSSAGGAWSDYQPANCRLFESVKAADLSIRDNPDELPGRAARPGSTTMPRGRADHFKRGPVTRATGPLFGAQGKSAATTPTCSGGTAWQTASMLLLR